MPSKARAVSGGRTYHFLQRGKHHQPCFFQAIDYQKYLDLWFELSRAHQVEVHAFVVMPDQVHFLLTPGSPNRLAKLSQALVVRYQEYFGDRYQWQGALWEENVSKGLITSPEELLGCYRHIELNAVHKPGEVRSRLSMVKLRDQCAGAI
jgi:putative transposase